VTTHFRPRMKYLLGYDIGSSSVKASLLEAESGRVVASATSPPSVEMPIDAPQAGFAEQHPDMWWQEVINATHRLKFQSSFDPQDIAAIGIAYQMHGLVMVDKNGAPLRPSIIWCDSRAVEIGNKAFDTLGNNYSLSHFLNSPGNFTASKLRWVIENQADIWEKTHKIMLPGDYIALRMTGEARTTISGLSEGIFWDFKNRSVATALLDYYAITEGVLAERVDTFAEQGTLTASAAQALGLSAGIPVAYRAGDQPNNAFSLNVLNVGEVAATAGTSGVVYGITAQADYDPQSRVNTFVHVNDTAANPRNGVLLCINGTGILNSWLRRVTGGVSYDMMNQKAAEIPIATEGVVFLPFGNGAERVLQNKNIGARLEGLDLNRHTQAHLFRAAQEGIVYALRYGFDIMKNMGVVTRTVRAGHANMFLSPVFREAFANTTGAVVELYNTDGAQGAARGAGIGIGLYKNTNEAFTGLELLTRTEPQPDLEQAYHAGYAQWLTHLNRVIL
jgi:xylulokinase